MSSCENAGRIHDCIEEPPASRWVLSRTRRWMEIAFAVMALALLSLPMLILGLCIRLTSRGPALFSQERVGMRGRRFKIYKFRSMHFSHGEQMQGLVTTGDPRITFLGRLMRKFKIDELPQFCNVVRGDLSLIGPRPKLPEYAALRNSNYRPGITGPATLAFRHEEEMIRGVAAPELDAFYAQNIKPVKARLDVCYMCRATPLTDLRTIVDTFLGCIRPKPRLASLRTSRDVKQAADRSPRFVADESLHSCTRSTGGAQA